MALLRAIFVIYTSTFQGWM